MFLSDAFRRRFFPFAIATTLIVTQLGCASTTPRQHWWEFWRPKKAETDVADMKPLNYEIPGETGDAGGEISIAPLSDDLAGRYEHETEEAYARLMNQPLDEPRREPAEPEARLRPVHFDFDRFDIGADAQSTLESNLAWLRQHPEAQVQIEGHCDERGTVEYNLLLGERRAKAVKAYLVARGVSPDRLDTISYGEERPVEPASTEMAYAKNRRAQFLAY